MKPSLSFAAALLLLSTVLVTAQRPLSRGQASPQFDQLAMMVFEKQLKQDNVTQMIPTRNAESLLTHRVDPVLPKPGKKADQNPFARGTSFTTIVVVVFEIDKKGKVRRAMVVSGPQQLQAAALNAVKKWTFKPFTDHGAPTAVGTSFQLSFRAR